MTSPNPFAPPGATTTPVTPPYTPSDGGQPAQPYGTQPFPAQPYGQPYPAQPYGQPFPPSTAFGGPFPGAPYTRSPHLRTGLAQGSLYTGLGALVVGLPFTVGVGAVVAGLVGLVLGVVALRRVRAGTGGGRAFAWWGIALSAIATVGGAALFAVTAEDAADAFAEGWEAGWEDPALQVPADDGWTEDLYDEGWSDGYDAGFEDGYGGGSDPIPAPGTPDSVVDAADVPQRPFGETGAVGVYSVTVLDVSLDADDVVVPAFPGNPPPEGRYVLATVSVTNTGSEPARPAMNLYHYYAGDDDLIYGDWTCGAWSPRPLADVGPLAPGETAEYDVCFDVPLHALGRPTLVVDDGTAAEYTFTQWSAP